MRHFVYQSLVLLPLTCINVQRNLKRSSTSLCWFRIKHPSFDGGKWLCSVFIKASGGVRNGSSDDELNWQVENFSYYLTWNTMWRFRGYFLSNVPETERTIYHHLPYNSFLHTWSLWPCFKYTDCLLMKLRLIPSAFPYQLCFLKLLALFLSQ